MEFFTPKEVVLSYLSNRDGEIYSAFALDFLDDKEFLLEATQIHGNALEYAGDKLRADRELVLSAVQSNGEAIKLADKALRKDKAIAIAAIESSVEAFKYIADDLKKDKEVLQALERSQKVDKLVQKKMEVAQAKVIHIWNELLRRQGIEFGKIIYRQFRSRHAVEPLEYCIEDFAQSNRQNISIHFVCGIAQGIDDACSEEYVRNRQAQKAQ